MSWRRLKLRKILNQVKIPIQIHDEKDYKLVTISNTGNISLRKIEKGSNISATNAYIAKKGAFIYSRLSIHNGAFGLVPDYLDGALITSEMPIFSIDENTLPDFLIYSLQHPSFRLQLNNLTKGMGRTRVKENGFLSLYVDIPSLEIQESIKNEIRDKQKLITHLSQESINQLGDLKKLRQQILQDAVQGKLVPQDPNDEPASNLLERITAEKEKLVREKIIKKGKPLPPINPEEIPFEIPKNWVWCRLGKISNTLSTGPFGTMLHKSDYVRDGIPLVNPMNMVNGRIIPSEKMMISEETKRKLKSYVLRENDVVIARRGKLGRSAIVTKKENGWLCGTGSFFISFCNNISTNYFTLVFDSKYSKQYLMGSSVGATMNNLNHRIINNLPIPIPPLEEQHSIVTKINQLMTLCDELEQTIQQNQKYTQELLQVALKESLEPTD